MLILENPWWLRVELLTLCRGLSTFSVSGWPDLFNYSQGHDCRGRGESVVCTAVLRGGGSQLLLNWFNRTFRFDLLPGALPPLHLWGNVMVYCKRKWQASQPTVRWTNWSEQRLSTLQHMHALVCIEWARFFQAFLRTWSRLWASLCKHRFFTA